MPAAHGRAWSGENELLARLPIEDREYLLPRTQLVELRHNEVLHRAGEPIRWAYFPLTAVLGVTSTLRDGSGSELGMIGHEGMAGLSTLLGARSTPFDVGVHVAGAARRLYASTLTEEMGGRTALGESLHLFTSAFLVQLAQGVTCACHHDVRQRLVRYLLMVHDRTLCDELPLTHEFLAHMLGVGRPTVTLTLAGLHAAELVALGRGNITLINRRGLEAATCECYASVRDEYQRLLPTAMPDGHETDRPSTASAPAMNGRTHPHAPPSASRAERRVRLTLPFNAERRDAVHDPSIQLFGGEQTSDRQTPTLDTV